MPFNFTLFASLRQQRGLTIYIVAAKLRVQPSTISRWERGLTQPYQKQIKTIAKFFRKKPSDFQEIPERGKIHGRKKRHTTSVASTEN